MGATEAQRTAEAQWPQGNGPQKDKPHGAPETAAHDRAQTPRSGESVSQLHEGQLSNLTAQCYLIIHCLCDDMSNVFI